MMQRLRQMRKQEGFTLIELLIVIVILGILAAIVVFAVNGITDRGQTSACSTDLKTLRTAEEAHFAGPAANGGNTYGTEAQLVSRGYLSEQSALHNIVVPGVDPDGAGPLTARPFDINPVAPC